MDRGRLHALIQELGLEASIELLGARDSNEVREYLDNSDIFVLPSVTAGNGDTEGFGIVNVEAQAAGIPVVSTNHNGIPEGVDVNRSAFLVPERDPVALAERLKFLMDHPERWPEMGRAGRRFVEQRFDIEKLNDELIDLYAQLRVSSEKAPTVA
jgi:colanic acid/amylovoran biosynthesis glycosyltransferase